MINRRFWLGLAISVFFLGLLLWQVDLGKMVESLRGANYWYIVPGTAIYFAVAVLFRTLRWRVLLSPLRAIPSGRLLPVVLVGYAANNLLPVRLGEVVRSYYVGRREDISASAALATIVVERVVDGVVLLFLLVVMSVLLPVSGLVEGLSKATSLPRFVLVAGTTIPFIGIMALLWLAARDPRWLMAVVKWVARWLPRGASSRMVDIAAKAMAGLSVLRSPRQMAVIFVLSAPVWLGEALMYYIIAIGFDLAPSLGGAWAMFVAILAATATSNLATALPASQGSIGPFELFATATLVVLGARAEVAAAYAVALHVALLVPITLAGLAYLWMGKDSLRQIIGMRDESAGPGSGFVRQSPPGFKGTP